MSKDYFKDNSKINYWMLFDEEALNVNHVEHFVVHVAFQIYVNIENPDQANAWKFKDSSFSLSFNDPLKKNIIKSTLFVPRE